MDYFQSECVQDWLSKVHAYDPTVSFPPLRGNSISFQKLGVAAKRLTMMNDTSNTDEE